MHEIKKLFYVNTMLCHLSNGMVAGSFHRLSFTVDQSVSVFTGMT